MGVSPDDPGAAEARDKSLQRIALASMSYCPDVDLQLCELESIRRRGAAGSEALCTSNCTETDFVDIEPKTCAAVDDYPSDLLANRNNAERSYEERACCKVGIDAPSDECPVKPIVTKSDHDDFPVGVVIGVAAGALVVICGLAVFCVVRRRYVSLSILREQMKVIRLFQTITYLFDPYTKTDVPGPKTNHPTHQPTDWC